MQRLTANHSAKREREPKLKISIEFLPSELGQCHGRRGRGGRIVGARGVQHPRRTQNQGDSNNPQLKLSRKVLSEKPRVVFISFLGDSESAQRINQPLFT